MAVKLEYEEIKSETVPTGWSLDYLENLCATSSGTTPPRSAAERYYRNGTIHWVKTTDLTNSNISFTEELITKTAVDETSLRVYPVGTVLVAMYGGFNQIGRTGLLKIPAAVNQAITAIQPDPKLLVSEYLINVLNYRVSYWKTVASSSRKDPNLTSHDIKKFPIIFPDISEQRTIATALSDVDALITSLDQLIAKKRDIKQATMQQLLTGKKRLPRFSRELKPAYKQTEIGMIPEDWEVKTVEEIANVRGGKRLPAGKTLSNSPTPYPYIRVTDMFYGGVSLNEIKYVPIEVFPLIKNYRIYKDDIFVTVAGTLGIVGKVPPELNGANLTENADKITNINCEGDYLLYTLMSPRIQRTIESEETVSAQPKLALNRIEKFRIALPTNKAEQQAIAAILSDMDAEIVALEQKRDKTRALKQGMMQELLTGKTRLV